MKQVDAYEDTAGRLHKSRKDAVEADFILLLQHAWRSMPDSDGRGDPVVIARLLMSDRYSNARYELREALSWFEKQTT